MSRESEETKYIIAKVKKIERRFIKDSDRIFNTSCEIKKGRLREMDLDALVNFDSKLGIRKRKLDWLAQEYSRILGDETYINPNYAKHSRYWVVVEDALDSEIELRYWAIGGCSLN